MRFLKNSSPSFSQTYSNPTSSNARADKQAYLAALKATAIPARWTEIKGAVEIAKASTVNDATIYRIIENLKAAMLIEEKENVYRINDPMLRTLLLTSQIT